MSGIDEVLAQLDKKTLERVQRASEVKTEYLPLASYGATKVLGGGIAKGRITLCYGNQSSGKSLLFEESVALWQKMNLGLKVAWVDTEGTFDTKFVRRLGLDPDDLIIVRARSFNKITDTCTRLIRAGVDVIIIDSISQAVPAVFVDDSGHVKDFDETKQVGAHAKACTMMVNSLHHENVDTAIVLISQTTTEFGQNYTKQRPHGGQKVLFASTMVLNLQSSGTEKNQIMGNVNVGDVTIQRPIGRRVKLYVEKNKAGPQSGRCEYDVYYAGNNLGIDRIGEVVDEAISYGIIKKAGAWFTTSEKKWQGRASVISYFKETPGALDDLEKEIHLVETGEVV